MKRGYRVFSSSWSNGYGRIPDLLLFAGHVFSTHKDAEEYWYDGVPERNDHCVVVPFGKPSNNPNFKGLTGEIQ